VGRDGKERVENWTKGSSVAKRKKKQNEDENGEGGREGEGGFNYECV
jgi:hypothetical protein